MKTGKHILSVLLAALMLLAAIPAAVLAEESAAPENLALGKIPAGTHLLNFTDLSNWNPSLNPDKWAMLTDGILGNKNNWGDMTTWLKMYRDLGRELIIDLGQIDTISSISMGFGQRFDVGIRTPEYVRCYVSNDGVSYTHIGKALPDVPIVIENTTPGTSNIDRKLYKIDKFPDGAPMNIQARFVKIVFYVDVNTWADEIEIMGCKGIVNDAQIPRQVPDDSVIPVNSHPAKYSGEAAGMAEQYLLYTGQYSNPETTNWTADEVRKILGYSGKDGDIKDWFFEDILVMPISNIINPSGKGLFEVKADYDSFLDFIFKQDEQLGTINKVAGELNTKFGTNKKVKIDIAVPFPKPEADARIHNFGDIRGDGSAVSFNPGDFASQVGDPGSVEGRLQMFGFALNNKIEAMKWYVNEVERRFVTAGYNNLELTSFYLYNETLNQLRDEVRMVRTVGDHIKSRNYKFTWIPYIGTISPVIWKEAGLSTATLQPNYAFGGKKIGQLPATVSVAKKYGMGIEMEYGWGSPNTLPMRRFIEYLNQGVILGYMKDTYHNYYLNATSLVDNAISADPVLRAFYDRIYDFTNENYTLRYLCEGLSPNLTDKTNITVPVKVLNASNFTEGSFSVLYDASKLDFKNYSVGLQLNGIGSCTADTSIPGVVIVNFKVNEPQKALYGDMDDPKDATRGRAEVVKLVFSKKDGVNDADITANLFVINRPGVMIDKNGNVYTNWSESAAIPDSMLASLISSITDKVTAAENSCLQADVDAARAAVNILPADEVKAQLQQRLDLAEEVINAWGKLAALESSLAAFESVLQGSDLSIENIKEREALIAQLKISAAAVLAECKSTSDAVSALPRSGNQALDDRVAGMKLRCDAVQGVINSIGLILDEAEKNPNSENGKGEIRLHVNKGSAISLLEQVRTEIANKLQTTDNLRWLSIDKSRASVDQSGALTAVENGVAKIHVYNDKGVLNICLVISDGE